MRLVSSGIRGNGNSKPSLDTRTCLDGINGRQSCTVAWEGEWPLRNDMRLHHTDLAIEQLM